MSATERDAFLGATLTELNRVEVALREGDVAPRLAAWSHADPVTLFGAAVTYRTGWEDCREVFEWIAGSLAGCDAYEFELVAADASGDMAYTVGIERYTATTVDGRTVQNNLRVTQVYRREEGAWKVVHRHGDHLEAAR